MDARPTIDITQAENRIRLAEARNCQSHTLVNQANELLRQAADIDLSNISLEILLAYPEAHTIILLMDHRTGYEDTVFCGHIDDENGKKIGNSYNAKMLVENTVSSYAITDKKSIVDRVINLREYAVRMPEWMVGTQNGVTLFHNA